MNSHSVSYSTRCLALVAVAIAGCGTNKFQREVQIEEAAIKLTKETIQGGYPLISTLELKALLDSGEDVLVLDAMPAADSFAKGHIAGAVNFEFPKEAITAWNDQTMPSRSKADFEALLGQNKDRKIVMYCGFVKCARSHNAALFARELGFSEVYRYPGGIDAWRGAGYPLTTK